MERCTECKKPMDKCECRKTLEKNRSLSKPPMDRMMDSSRKDAVIK